MNKNKFILVEGLDGSGKSSVASELSKQFNMHLLHSPEQQFQPLSKYIQTCDNYTKLLFYMSANFDVSEKIKKLIKTSNVICDRYYLSTITSFSFFERCPLEIPLEMTQQFTNIILKPDKVIYLTIPEEIRVQRLKDRSVNAGKVDKIFEKNVEEQKRAEKIFLQLLENQVPDYLLVDSSGTVEQTVKIIKEKCNL